MFDERALFRSIAGGDKEAFRHLFHHYHKQLRPFVLKLTKSTHAAEEVMQEVFLKLWLRREKLAEIEQPRAYLIRMISNESINFLRSQAKDDKLLESITSLLSETAPSAEASIFYRETEKKVEEAIDRLPAACRNIYRMSREQYMRIPEIAETLNPSDSTVKNQLVKALKIIRLHIGDTAPFLIFILLPH